MARPEKAKVVRHALPTNINIIAAVGKIALHHGQLDNALRMIIKDLTGVNQTEALDATARDGSRELRERIRRLARQRLGEGAALVRLQALLERAGRITQKRNELLHAVWGTELDGGPMMRGDDHEFRPIPTVGQLKGFDNKIMEITNDLINARLDGFLLEALKKPAHNSRG
jgi:hypothetical protein